MRAIAGNPRLRNVLRGCGLERAAAFSWRRTARETHDIYREVSNPGTGETDERMKADSCKC